jgi:hypothetical protein
VELDESGSRENLGKRPAFAGLFIVFDAGQGIIASLLLPLDLSRWRGKRVAGSDEQDDYFYPRSILGKEGAGRWWAINNTSNISGVE